MARVQGYESIDGKRTRLTVAEAAQLAAHEAQQERLQAEFVQHLKQTAYAESVARLAALKATTTYDASASSDLEALKAKATKIADLGGDAAARDTVAVGIGEDGKHYGAAQRNWKERKGHGLEAGVMLFDQGAPDHVHAEMWLLYIQWALEQGKVASMTVGAEKMDVRQFKITHITANRPVCQNCAQVLKAAGVVFDPKFTQPNTERWVDPWTDGVFQVPNPFTSNSSLLVAASAAAAAAPAAAASAAAAATASPMAAAAQKGSAKK
ncbi:hypothetical protein A7982_13311 [Minicystis rosea]|nr:hypothetical protein A7982_13311 [Minicystis rosea]